MSRATACASARSLVPRQKRTRVGGPAARRGGSDPPLGLGDDGVGGIEQVAPVSP